MYTLWQFFENLFFWDSHQYPNDATWKIWNHNIYYQVSCGYLHKSKTKSTRFVCLVLTGLSVVNFFIRDNLGLIFLHSTHIMFLGSHMNVVLKILVWKKSKFKGFTMKNTYMQYIHMCALYILLIHTIFTKDGQNSRSTFKQILFLGIRNVFSVKIFKQIVAETIDINSKMHVHKYICI